MYKRFVRWASDRLQNNGVLAFITNRTYLDGKQDDGFRKVLSDEFSNIYIVDLGGDIRKSRKKKGFRPVGNVFDIQTGVAIGFFVCDRNIDTCKIHYSKVEDRISRGEKLAWLSVNKSVENIEFQEILPDKSNNWLDQPNPDNGFDDLVSLVNDETKDLKFSNIHLESAVFKLFSLGVSTNRDDWVYDFDNDTLCTRMEYFTCIYNNLLNKNDRSFPTKIKWSRDLVKKFNRGLHLRFKNECITKSMHRPFVEKFHYADFAINDVLTKKHRAMLGDNFDNPNKIICFTNPTATHSFQVLCVAQLPDLHMLGDTKIIPLFCYDEYGQPFSNITAFGLDSFQSHYNDKNITAEDIFYYTYAVLHNPAYREKYEINLIHSFPKLPFYPSFDKWVKWGKRLANIHVDYNNVDLFQIKREDSATILGKTATLKAYKDKGMIVIDEQTQLSKIPAEAWEYKFGRYSAVEHVLKGYKQKRMRASKESEKFMPYTFHEHKEDVIHLISRVCTVSVETTQITRKMASESKKY